MADFAASHAILDGDGWVRSLYVSLLYMIKKVEILRRGYVLQMPDHQTENIDEPVQIITCPYCDYEKPMFFDRLPTKPVAATCPKCSSRFMFRPTSRSGLSVKSDSSGISKTRYRGDYDIIKKDLISFYADIFSKYKGNLVLITVLFVLYGLMYLIVTSVYCLQITSEGRYVARLSDYLLIASSYGLFAPVMLMHSWKFVDTESLYLIDRLFSYKSVFLLSQLVMLCYW